MAFVQSAVSATTSITLNGVTAGNTLVLIVGWYRDPSTLAVYPTPTDNNGTVQVAVSPVPSKYTGTGNHDAGTSIFYVPNANGGTHTFTLSAITAMNSTLVEFNSMAVASFDVATSGLTNGPSSALSQGTGTTGATAQANEIVVIGCTLAADASLGVTDVGWTDPVSGFTNLQKKSDLQNDLPVLHQWKEISSIGTQLATFNWANHSVTTEFMQASIATFQETTVSGPILWAQGMI